MTKIAIIYYSLYGHIAGFAESIKKGVEEGGATCDIYQVEETLSDEILGKMGAPPKKDYPVMTADMMTEYDGFLFGISGRFGSVPAQLKVCFQPHHEVMGFLLASLQNSHISSLQ
jgi:NAD(P)H dehydrogenase (quinone)